MRVNDVHCHFFSRRFFEALGEQMRAAGPVAQPPPAARAMSAEEMRSESLAEDPDSLGLATRLGWEAPGSAEQLADRWAHELDHNRVVRAALIASVPGDEDSVAAAVARHPSRFVGFFMLDPTRPDAVERVQRALGEKRMRAVCLFPAMHRYSLHDERVAGVFETVAAVQNAAVFVHCGVLTVGVRKKLGLASRFDLTRGNPLDLHVLALSFPHVPIIIPHFGAGFFREALMVADLCPNVMLDTSSSNSWVKYVPGLTLPGAFRQALEVLGPARLIFGTDSSFFPRGWHRPVFELETAILEKLQVDHSDQKAIFGGNFDRMFPSDE